MNKNIPRITIVAIMSALLTISFYFPFVLSDKNKFLNSFTNGSYLSVMGTVVSITVASCSNIYLRLGQLEVDGKGPFPGTKRALQKSAFSLIVIFAGAFFILIIKGAVGSSDRVGAFSNSVLIGGMFFFCSVLFDISRTAFKLPAK